VAKIVRTQIYKLRRIRPKKSNHMQKKSQVFSTKKWRETNKQRNIKKTKNKLTTKNQKKGTKW
jgi:hypothetical protein